MSLATRIEADDMRSGWFGVRCDQCSDLGPVMEENDLCQQCSDQIALRASDGEAGA